MTRPRPVYRDKTSMVTRRTHMRRLSFLGGPIVDQVIKYTLAYYARKHDIDVHAFIVEGNHIHLVVTDNHGNIPDFYRDLHGLIARQLNAHSGEHDSLWSGSQTNVVGSEDNGDILRRIVYAMGNPVADGIERHGSDHKGIRQRWPCPPEVIERPPFFWRPLDKGGIAPDRIALEFKRPPGFDGLADNELDRIIEDRVLAYEAKRREARDAAGLPWLCDKPDHKPDPRAFPKSKPTLFRLAPLIGARIKAHRLRAIERLRTFRTDHDDAIASLRAGETNVMFPHGTYLAARRWNVDVAPAPS